MTNEKPILFNADMVRAVLDGRKTQTRRILKAPSGNGWFKTWLGEIKSSHPKRGKWGHFFKREIWSGSGKYEMDLVPCPFGKIGDELWVRETWRADIELDKHKPSDMPHHKVWYEETDSAISCRRGKVRQSVFMPRWASRIQLRITDVRVERVQDISEGDARKEGITQGMCWGEWCSAVDWFESLWDSIYAERGYSWESNPCVWVIEFERVKP